MASAYVIQGPDKGRSYDLPDHGEAVIGRTSQTIELSDKTVSRRHARLYPQDGGWVLEDLGAANGTYLNGVRIKKPSPLHRGDQIRCGQTLLVFGGSTSTVTGSLDLDESGQLIDVAIVASMPSNEDSVIIPTPEAGAQAIGNLRIIYDLISQVSSVFRVDQLLQRTLDKVFEVLKADRGYVMLVNEQTGDIELKASHMADGSTQEGAPPISRTMINEVISKQVGLLSSNAMTDKRFASGKSVHDFGIRSAICVPIKGRDRILGVMHVDCSVSEHTYSTEQLRLLTAIGYHTGLAVENAWLYEQNVQTERLAAIGETVASLSHHIKNILQALGAGTDVVEMALEKDNLGRAKDAWPIVQRNLGKINHLILNMLAFSKEREPLLEPININQVIGESIELVAPQAEEAGIALLADLDDMPPIPADSGGLSQAVLNLLNNAMDAVEPGEGAITVKTHFDTMNRQAVIDVIDNGSGIPADQIDKIFNPFYSAKGQRGTGLGLAVTRKVIEEHHGEIRVNSTPGEGTTFTISLPSAAGRDPSDTASPPATVTA